MKSMYMFEYNLLFDGKFDFTIPLKEQKNGEYYWRENGNWYRNRPCVNVSLCEFLVKSVENRLRRKSRIYYKLRDDYAENSDKCCINNSFTELITVEDARKIINMVVDDAWNNCMKGDKS